MKVPRHILEQYRHASDVERCRMEERLRLRGPLDSNGEEMTMGGRPYVPLCKSIQRKKEE